MQCGSCDAKERMSVSQAGMGWMVGMALHIVVAVAAFKITAALRDI